MGELNVHNLKDLIKDNNCTVFVETGSGIGEGLNYATQFNFDHLFSIEYVEDLYNKCVVRFVNNPKVSILNNNSIDGLEEILERISRYYPDVSIMFWLDAHFPGADFHYNSYDHMMEIPELHTPLINELDIIQDIRPNSKDVFIIDDWQLYEDGNYELTYPSGFIERYKFREAKIADKVYSMFEDTHTFTKVYRHQGSLVIEPKKS